ncbi:MAG: BlaI/MecI/CopY family transcriptional regulator [Candidatus Latescibacterota bacterium]|nr:MAG: BlaI/MecI/CopY family transcriptional regulator [Candidatus Latescibacterota bacterium]
MATRNKLTPVEWEIMEAIWGLKSACTVRDVLDSAFPNGEKAYTTVQTIMNTLEKKGLLRRKKTGLVNFYRPARTRDHMIKAEMSSLLSRVFDGSVPELANSLLKLDDVKLEELRKIKKLIEDKERELRGENR